MSCVHYTPLMLIAVGSLNPVKIEAARLAFESHFPDAALKMVGVAAKSGVSDQPMTARETIAGAKARAKEALRLMPEATFGIGLEGGLHEVDGTWFDMGWIVVRDREGREGIGTTAGMPVGGEVMRLILQENKELGHAIDIAHGTNNIKQSHGYFGLMTNNRITRTSGYRDAVIIAISHLKILRKEKEAGATVHFEM